MSDARHSPHQAAASSPAPSSARRFEQSASMDPDKGPGMGGRVTAERMAQLRRQSKLRERLVSEIEDLDEQLQVAHADLNRLADEDAKINRQVITYDERRRLRRKVEGDVAAKEDEIAELKDQLGTAVQELNDYDETTQMR